MTITASNAEAMSSNMPPAKYTCNDPTEEGVPLLAEYVRDKQREYKGCHRHTDEGEPDHAAARLEVGFDSVDARCARSEIGTAQPCSTA